MILLLISWFIKNPSVLRHTVLGSEVPPPDIGKTDPAYLGFFGSLNGSPYTVLGQEVPFPDIGEIDVELALLTDLPAAFAYTFGSTTQDSTGGHRATYICGTLVNSFSTAPNDRGFTWLFEPDKIINDHGFFWLFEPSSGHTFATTPLDDISVTAFTDDIGNIGLLGGFNLVGNHTAPYDDISAMDIGWDIYWRNNHGHPKTDDIGDNNSVTNSKLDVLAMDTGFDRHAMENPNRTPLDTLTILPDGNDRSKANPHSHSSGSNNSNTCGHNAAHSHHATYGIDIIGVSGGSKGLRSSKGGDRASRNTTFSGKHNSGSRYAQPATGASA